MAAPALTANARNLPPRRRRFSEIGQPGFCRLSAEDRRARRRRRTAPELPGDDQASMRDRRRIKFVTCNKRRKSDRQLTQDSSEALR